MKGALTDAARVFHVLEAISEVEKYLTGVSLQDFLCNSEKRFATIKQIEIVGEACNRISKDLKNKHPEIKWGEISGFRNISIHEYFGVDYRIVWEIAKSDLPVLKHKFDQIKGELSATL
ncbi:MAG TPA: DUF86 domain-containing protein [Cyclobacteriaceae bacterium]|nr:DUF86 domain-containing protein [Cyclobacteriaceae bacterium]